MALVPPWRRSRSSASNRTLLTLKRRSLLPGRRRTPMFCPAAGRRPVGSRAPGHPLGRLLILGRRQCPTPSGYRGSWSSPRTLDRTARSSSRSQISPNTAEWERPSRAITRGASTEAPVAVAAAPAPILHPRGPSGVQPKNRLTIGVWTIAARAAAEATVDATVQGVLARLQNRAPSGSSQFCIRK